LIGQIRIQAFNNEKMNDLEVSILRCSMKCILTLILPLILIELKLEITNRSRRLAGCARLAATNRIIPSMTHF
jgi:hypothetical protein